MKVIILVLVIIAALFAIASGVWVAIALVRSISPQANEEQQGQSPQNRQTGFD
jgi:hypothetical protein